MTLIEQLTEEELCKVEDEKLKDAMETLRRRGRLLEVSRLVRKEFGFTRTQTAISNDDTRVVIELSPVPSLCTISIEVDTHMVYTKISGQPNSPQSYCNNDDLQKLITAGVRKYVQQILGTDRP